MNPEIAKDLIFYYLLFCAFNLGFSIVGMWVQTRKLDKGDFNTTLFLTCTGPFGTLFLFFVFLVVGIDWLKEMKR